MKKRAQLEIMQSIFIGLFLILILIIAFAFVAGRNISNKKSQIEQLEILTDYKKAQIIDYLPEIRCIFENVIMKDCYDKYAIQSFQITMSENKLYYISILGLSKITINEFDEEWKKTEIYKNEPDEKKAVKTFFNPVIIYDALKAKKNFGVIEIEIYE